MFESSTTIWQKLEESFSEKLASTEFQIGYIEKRCNVKRWTEEPADCKSMYDSYRKGDTITLWCICVKDDDGDAQPAIGRKPKKTDEASLSSSSKRDVHESEVDKVFHELPPENREEDLVFWVAFMILLSHGEGIIADSSSVYLYRKSFN